MAYCAIPFALRFFGIFKSDIGNEVGPLKAEERQNYPDWNGVAGAEYVHKLTGDNLEAFIKGSERAIIMYYAPWCGHCRVMKPEFARAAQNLAIESPKSLMGCLDCAQYPRVQERYKIQGYPTLKYYSGGNYIGEYQRARKASEFINFMLRKPSSQSDL